MTLGHRPNIAARALVTGKTNVLGVISFDTTLYGPASMLYGIERAARPGYFVAIASLPSFDRASLTSAVERFLGQAVAGIIVIAPQTGVVGALAGLSAGVPPRRRGLRRRGAVAFRSSIDDVAGAMLATRAPARPRAPDRAPHRRPGQLA